MSVVVFSLSTPDVNLDRGTWAIERRDRGRADPAESLLDAMRQDIGYHRQIWNIKASQFQFINDFTCFEVLE